MAEAIAYNQDSYGIMPIDALNRYQRFQNQRRAATGISAPYSDTKAFWEGTMDAVAKNSASRAARALEQKRLDATTAYQNAQLALQERGLENSEDASKRSAISGLTQIPLTYMMYKSLGLGGKDTSPGWLSETGSAIGGWAKKLFDTGTTDLGYDTATDLAFSGGPVSAINTVVDPTNASLYEPIAGMDLSNTLDSSGFIDGSDLWWGSAASALPETLSSGAISDVGGSIGFESFDNILDLSSWSDFM